MFCVINVYEDEEDVVVLHHAWGRCANDEFCGRDGNRRLLLHYQQCEGFDGNYGRLTTDVELNARMSFGHANDFE
jgi:hypothetical protein